MRNSAGLTMKVPAGAKIGNAGSGSGYQQQTCFISSVMLLGFGADVLFDGEMLLLQQFVPAQPARLTLRGNPAFEWNRHLGFVDSSKRHQEGLSLIKNCTKTVVFSGTLLALPLILRAMVTCGLMVMVGRRSICGINLVSNAYSSPVPLTTRVAG